jgi:hypothetical protein
VHETDKTDKTAPCTAPYHTTPQHAHTHTQAIVPTRALCWPGHTAPTPDTRLSFVVGSLPPRLASRKVHAKETTPKTLCTRAMSCFCFSLLLSSCIVALRHVYIVRQPYASAVAHAHQSICCLLLGYPMLRRAVWHTRITVSCIAVAAVMDHSALRAPSACSLPRACITGAAHSVWLTSNSIPCFDYRRHASLIAHQCRSTIMSSSASSPSSHAVSMASPPAPCFLLSRFWLSTYSFVSVSR